MSSDMIVVGSGPNGLAAAIVLLQAGHTVTLYEGATQPGGGMRSASLTLPGFIHDVCSTIYALAAGSSFFNSLPLARYGLQWVRPPAALAHPFDDGTLVLLEGSVAQTAEGLGSDAPAYRKLMEPFVLHWDALSSDLLGPLRLPSHPLLALHFGYYGLRPAAALLSTLFQKPPARALFAGLAAHAAMSLHKTCTASFGMILGILGHLTGWPIARGGSQQLAHALVSHFRSLGGRLLLNTPVTTLAELPAYAAVLCDVTPRQLLSLAADQLPAAYSRQLEHYRYGPGAFKIDWALNGPIPWKASGCARAATVHLGGAWQEIVAAEEQVWAGKIPEQPFVLLTQPTLFDGTRAPIGAHTAWAYCHVPHNASVDMTERIEAQVERFAAGFRQRILARHTFSPQALQRYNPNYIGGDINGGLQDFKQLYTRPLPRYVPYATPVPGLYLCSSSTPPGGGVHGLCGYHAAQAVLKKQSRFGSPTRIRP